MEILTLSQDSGQWPSGLRQVFNFLVITNIPHSCSFSLLLLLLLLLFFFGGTGYVLNTIKCYLVGLDTYETPTSVI